MGVDINTYRCRVGMFVPGGGCGFVSLFITFGRVVKFLASLTLIRILLVMACVEQNPGPVDKHIFCYQYLLIEIGTDVMRRIFDIRVGNNFGKYLSANNTENGKLQKMILAKIITADQIEILPPVDNSPKSINFDITLLSCLLRNVCGLRSRSNVVWMNPTPTDVSLEADLARLNECRNNFQLHHSETGFISETDLKVKWNELSQILTRLNAVCGIPNLSELINTAEKMEIDEELQKRHDQAIKAWIKIEDEIEGLNISYSELKTKAENIKQSHESTQSNFGMGESDLRNHHCRTLPVTPVCDKDEVEVELLSIYEPPALYHVPYHRTAEKEEIYSISSYDNDIDNDGSFYDDDDFEDYNDDVYDNDGYCFDDNDHDDYDTDDYYKDGSFRDNNTYENYTDDDNHNDGYCHHDNNYKDYNEYEDYNEYDKDNDDYGIDDNDYDTDDTDYGSDDNDYGSDDNDYEDYNEYDNDSDEYSVYIDYYGINDNDDNDFDGNCSNNNYRAYYKKFDKYYDVYCLNNNVNDDRKKYDNDVYCPDYTDNEYHKDYVNDNDVYCPDDTDNEDYDDYDIGNDGNCPVTIINKNTIIMIMITMVIGLMMLIMNINDDGS